MSAVHLGKVITDETGFIRLVLTQSESAHMHVTG